MLFLDAMESYSPYRSALLALALTSVLVNEGACENPALTEFGSRITHYVSFDMGDTNAELSNGNANDVHAAKGAVEFVAGAFGKGLRFTEAERTVQFPGSGIVDFSQPGSLAIWVSAQNWDRSLPEEYYFFVRIQSEEGNLLLGKSNQQGASDFIYAHFQANGESPVSVRQGSTANWEDGEWHLLVLSWGKESIELSVDGSESAYLGIPKFSEQGGAKWVVVGAGKAESRNVALDEVMFFNSPLQPAEITKLYESRQSATSAP